MAVLRRPLARIDPDGVGRYVVRLGRDRRTRVQLTLDEVTFRHIAGLAPLALDGDGWVLGRTATSEPYDRAARPGVVEGEREILDPDSGAPVRRKANLAESPVAWLARRRDAQGRPWLQPREVMAAERLRADWERAGVLGRLTMDWSGLPRSGAGWTGVDPAERDRTTKDRLARALDALDPPVRSVAEQVVLTGRTLAAVERAQRLPRGAARVMLQLALTRLADHYGLG